MFAVLLSSPGADGIGEAYVANLEGAPALTRGAVVRPLAEGDSLRVGDRISTGEDGSVEIVLGDGSVIEAGERTRLVIRNLAAVRGVLRFEAGLDAGFVSNTVIPARGIEYRISTPTGTAGVRGTEFNVAFDESEDGTDLSVEEGRVEVESAGGERQEVRAGTSGRFSRARFERRDDVRDRLAARREAVRAKIRTALERRFRSHLESGRTPTEGEIYRAVPERVRSRMSEATRNRFREKMENRIRSIRERSRERREERRPTNRRPASGK